MKAVIYARYSSAASEKNLSKVKLESVLSMPRRTALPFSATTSTELCLQELLTVPNFKA